MFGKSQQGNGGRRVQAGLDMTGIQVCKTPIDIMERLDEEFGGGKKGGDPMRLEAGFVADRLSLSLSLY